MNFTDEHVLTITSPIAPGIETVLRVNDQPEAWTLFRAITDCLVAAMKNGQPDRMLYRNRRMGMALGTDVVVPLDVAHGHWQSVAAMSDWVPCHCCDTGNGLWAPIEADWEDLPFVGRCCSACWAAFGLDGDPDE